MLPGMDMPALGGAPGVGTAAQPKQEELAAKNEEKKEEPAAAAEEPSLGSIANPVGAALQEELGEGEGKKGKGGRKRKGKAQPLAVKGGFY